MTTPAPLSAFLIIIWSFLVRLCRAFLSLGVKLLYLKVGLLLSFSLILFSTTWENTLMVGFNGGFQRLFLLRVVGRVLSLSVEAVLVVLSVTAASAVVVGAGRLGVLWVNIAALCPPGLWSWLALVRVVGTSLAIAVNAVMELVFAALLGRGL